MKALILAAGMGTRLRPLTDNKPKSMVEVNGVPILFKQLYNLMNNGIKDITIVAGYCADVIVQSINKSFPFVKVIVNEEYETTNNMYSAYLAKQNFINSEFLLMNADVFYDEMIINELIKSEYGNAVVVEQGEYNDENMKVKVIDGKIVGISKEITDEDSFGVSIDVYKFNSNGSISFFNKIVDYIENKKELNQWTEIALNDVLIDVEFKPCPLKGRWMEIDNHEDLRKAESIFNDSL
ncbi:phosphocholine cytidylyltransferase family protein [Mesobacillus jeotgali]|uniref:phosphocholine cytidylyltransferase family protein n=1 Tax=Mesobacillus jeotgali TaxID=129985 RepID=UPI000C867028|nr:phosphocholine cytidylyltransferase family protein [Mesobacillus jeotgali]